MNIESNTVEASTNALPFAKRMLADDADFGAEFSDDRKYRFALWRIWDRSKPLVMFVGLNPSTANETSNDPTIKSVCRIAKNNGYGGAYMMNCFPIVSTDPKVCETFYTSWFPYEHHQFAINQMKLKDIGAICKDIVFAWGNFEVVKKCKRDKELSQIFPNAMALSINKNGSPKHPLYCKSDTKFVKWESV